MAVAYASTEAPGSRVQGSHAVYKCTGYVTTGSYVDLAFEDPDGNALTNGLVPCAQFISLNVTALATTQNGLIKILYRAHPDGDEIELQAETTLTAGTAAEVYSGVVRAHSIVVQVKESVSGGTVDAYVCLK
jgi:hypothetical protein